MYKVFPSLRMMGIETKIIPPGYTTKHELDFIATIGTYSQFGTLRSRAHFLRQYIKASEQRINWDKIDGKKCIEFARQELAREGRRL